MNQLGILLVKNIKQQQITTHNIMIAILTATTLGYDRSP